MQLKQFKIGGGNAPPPLDKIEDKQELKTVLHRYTKANLKLNIPLEPQQLVQLIDHFLDCTYQHQISVTFKDWPGFRELISNFSSQTAVNVKSISAFDLQKYVEVKMKHRNTFTCFLFFLERKYK